MREDVLKAALSVIGSRGGKRRPETMTAEQRSEIARVAAKASAAARRKAEAKG
jgi:hypothetical protein